MFDPDKGAKRPKAFDPTLCGDDAIDLAAKCIEWVVLKKAAYYGNRGAEVGILHK